MEKTNFFENNPQEIIRKSALVFLNTMLGTFLGYVTFLLVARNMGKEVLGIVGFALSFVGVFSVIGDLSLSSAHTKRISESRDLGKCIGTYLWAKIILIIFMIIATELGILIWGKMEKLKLIIPTQTAVLQIILLYFIIRMLASVIEVTFAARREIGKIVISMFSLNLARLAATIFIIWAGWGVLALAGTYVTAGVVSLLTGFFLFRNYPIGSLDFSYLKSYWQFALPLSVSFSLQMISNSLPVILVYFFWTPEETGLYFAALKFLMPIFGLGIAIRTVIFPTISSLYSQGRLDSIHRLSLKAERLISLIAAPVVLFIVFFTQPIIRNFLRGDFLSASATLKILALGSFFYIINIPYFLQFRGTKYPGVDMKISLIETVFMFGLCLLFIPSDLAGYRLLGLKGFGASLSILGSSLVWFFMTRVLVYRLTETRPSGKFIFHLLTAALSFGVVYLIMKSFPNRTLVYLLISGLGGTALYLTILYVIKELRKDDFMLFLHALSPRAISEYLWSEIKI